MLPPFLDKKWPHGFKTERKTASNFVPTKRLPKGLKIRLLVALLLGVLGLLDVPKLAVVFFQLFGSFFR